ncbi:alpha/beta-type small acid-soluble spore protein [Desulfuribacillus alkaliarsenatis]|uniref:Spore protein n=1 Tax=Desulfuribacillus alkaliarsenatis TaxID=766136 RepID=A0A1E5FYF2_9FIRM|nr:alpha/beta-type small acid-soluble spore protein [Desulfuribacillus alkaliarsenatis]OEF95602.1 spore protein [Desulfuribacillus alkaliarsenatis]
MGVGQERPSNWLVVPEAYQALDQFKYEVASELGIQTPQNGYWGTMTSRDCGAVGGNITRKLVQLGEQQLMGSQSNMQ